MQLEINIWDENNIRDSVRHINKWLTSIKDNKLQFQDDDTVFYKVKTITISNFAYEEVDFIAVFTIDLTLDPHIYLEENKPVIIKENYELNNMYSLCKPIYEITGEGYVTLTINNKVVKINVGQRVVIDSDFQECYRDGLQAVNVIEGDYENMWLQEGKNYFSYTGGTNIQITITPNWRW